MKIIQKIAFLMFVSLICSNAHAMKNCYKGPDLRQQRQQVLRVAKHLQKVRTAPTARFEQRHPARVQAETPSNRQKMLGLLFALMVLNAEIIHALPATQKIPKGSKPYAMKDLKSLGMNRTDGSYSINLMWINRSLNATQAYICPDSSNQAYGSNPAYACLSGAFRWASVSRGSIVNFWYDSALTPAKAVNDTQALIKEQAARHPERAPIVLRDIREIPRVAIHPEVFSDRTPVYFRTDLLRPVIAHHVLSNSEANYFVYSDVDIRTPLSQKRLFDDETLKKLRQYGFVMANYDTFSHAFMIINNRRNFLKAMESAMIELNIQRACNALKGNFKTEWTSEPTKALGDFVVHLSFPTMFQYFLSLEGYGQLLCEDQYESYESYLEKLNTFRGRIPKRPYNPAEGSMQFGPFYLCAGFDHCKLDIDGYTPIPTKNVDLSPMSGKYDF